MQENLKLEELLKEINEKKAKIDKARPLPKIIADKLSEYFTVEWTYNSNAIEGNLLPFEVMVAEYVNATADKYIESIPK